tara:strand:- start:493 stop:1755 length:1263 start_codon:yes stop_codon:yes gene_type:complete
MKFDFSKTNNLIFIFITLYISLIVGFYFDENLNYGAKPDWYNSDLPVINDLSVNLKKTLLNYEDYGHRHSPVYLIFLGFLKKIGFSFDVIRLIHLNISILLIYLFYKCLVFKFDNIEKGILLILSFSVFLSPTFRSLAIWPSSRIIGLLFFTLSILEFLKYLKYKKNIHIWKNTIFLIFSSYISPNFSLFIFFFSYHYFRLNNLRDLIYLYLFCLVSSLPVFYYLIILDVNFLMVNTPGTVSKENISLSFNFADKILIISSIILFHLAPLIINKNFFFELIKSKKKDLIIVSIIFIFLGLFFNYQPEFTGGGIFFQISNFFFKNNTFFYLISFLSLFLLYFFIKKSLDNFLIFLLLIVSNLQNTIYHKYYDPLIMILFFSLLILPDSLKFFDKRSNIFIVYIFYILYIFLRIAKNSLLNI